MSAEFPGADQNGPRIFRVQSWLPVVSGIYISETAVSIVWGPLRLPGCAGARTLSWFNGLEGSPCPSRTLRVHDTRSRSRGLDYLGKMGFSIQGPLGGIPEPRSLRIPLSAGLRAGFWELIPPHSLRVLF
jgi:hypothetical protein